MHLSATVALYASVIAIINLILSSINYAFPDKLAGYFSVNSIAWPISALIVLVPALYIVEHLINRDLTNNPAKIDLLIRRFRIYLTLFLTGATILVDLIILINTYLNGEITMRFVYKVLAVIIVSGLVFAYYLLTKNETNNKKTIKSLAYLGIVVTILAIVGGFLIVGSPAHQRDLRYDNERVNDLTNIQWQVLSHWQQKSVLPEKLEELNDSISGYTIPTDPEDSSAYTYNVKGNYSFELCANFGTKSEDNSGRGSYARDIAVSSAYPLIETENINWKHEAGKVCFERKIDPSKYSPIKPVEIVK